MRGRWNLRPGAAALGLLGAAIALAVLLAAAPARAEDQPAPKQDLSTVDLSGAWYVLLHYKDEKSEDKSLTKFKDFAWSIEQTANTLTLEHYPFVFFDEDTELERRRAMREHQPWAPGESHLEKLARSVDVSSRAMTRKPMTGSVGEGFRSLPPITSGGLNTLGYTVSWEVAFSPDKIRIVVTDSLSGVGGLADMEESTVYTILERVGPDELRGTYQEATKRGNLRMIRAAERRVLK